MIMRLTGHSMEFLCGERLAGSYCYTDPFKCYLHPLNTPEGYTVSLRSPEDHRHHKGLFYGLRTQRVIFWEEYSTRPGETVGQQLHTKFTSTVFEGDTVGFAENLAWKSRRWVAAFLGTARHPLRDGRRPVYVDLAFRSAGSTRSHAHD